jgi:hypothetical protein
MMSLHMALRRHEPMKERHVVIFYGGSDGGGETFDDGGA